MNPEESLDNLSIFDGRQRSLTAPLAKYFSEGALYRYRVHVEIEWLKFLLVKTDFAVHTKDLTGRDIAASADDIEKLSEVEAEFSPVDAYTYERVGKNGRKPTDHDVKAMELAIIDIMREKGLGHLAGLVHIGLTSEDVNSVAYGLMLSGAVECVWLQNATKLIAQLSELSERYASTSVLGRTHGLPASPTTIGKQFAVVLSDLTRHVAAIRQVRLAAKFGGPVGNHNAFILLMPDFDIRQHSRKFVQGLGLEYVEAANQTTLHSDVIELFNCIEQFNLALLNLANLLRDSVLLGRLSIKNDSVGSSVMAHKSPNPWRLEAVEAFVVRYVSQLAAAKLTLKNQMLENSIGYHAAERAYGEFMALSLICICHTAQQLAVISVNEKNCSMELAQHYEVFSEALNLAMRLNDHEGAYFDIMQRVQGQSMSHEQYLALVRELDLPPMVTKRLSAEISGFVGDAEAVTRSAIADAKSKNNT